jgi:hypothetical protein
MLWQRTAPVSTWRVLRFAIDQLYSRHWPTGIESQLYGDHFVKVGTRHGLKADIDLLNLVPQRGAEKH